MNGQASEQPLGWVDTALVVVFLLGIYLGVNLQITSTIPLTCAPSGVAGLILLWRRRDHIRPAHLGGLLAITALFIGSILSAPDYRFLGKRFTGLLQLTYSLVIGYAFFITMIEAERRQVARILLTFCVAILAGVALEQYAGLRPISDAVRERIYDSRVVYDADLRDMVLYGRVRPKLFTSEPSNVTFSFTHYGFIWLVVSQWRWKFAVYAALMAMGFALMPGPTLLLMLMLMIPYLVFLHGRQGGAGGSTAIRLVSALALSAVLVVAAIVIGSSLYAERIREFTSGKDASTFFRVIGPMLIAFDVFKNHPWAGAGLTGDAYIEVEAASVYMNSGRLETGWYFSMSDVVTNYFWLHWIYLGLVWGTIMLVALSVWLRMLGVPSVLFCWSVWAILGQAAGAYVGPRAWSVLMIAAACAVLSVRQARSPAGAGRGVVLRRQPTIAALMAARRERYG